MFSYFTGLCITLTYIITMDNELSNIDTSIWITQQALATELNTSVQRVHNWISRGKIKSKYIKAINVTLVDRTSISIGTTK